MPYLKNKQLEDMIKAVDPSSRGLLKSIIQEDVSSQILCDSETCKGRHVGDIYTNGRVVATEDKDGKMWLRSSRKRFDGFMGFECWCGNDSRLAEQERGIIGKAAPSKSHLEKVWENIQAKPPQYKKTKGATTIDGFRIKEVA